MRVVLAALVLALAACGGEQEADSVASPPPTDATAGAEDCTQVDAAGDRAYLVCRARGPQLPAYGRFVVEEDGRRRELAVEAPTTAPSGHWAWAAVSPDGETLLAQWIAECEVPVAYFVSAEGGIPRPVVAKDVMSIALGWTREGAAEIALPEGSCGGGAARPGVYTVRPAGGKPQYLRPIDLATDTARG
jgi:hypothetical protein